MSAPDHEVEPFGYWVDQKGAEPTLLRKPAYIPEPSETRTVTPLYAQPATSQEGEVLAWRERDGDEWVYYDADSDTGEHIAAYQRDRHNVSVFPLIAALVTQEGNCPKIPDSSIAATSQEGEGRPCNFYLGDCTRCGKRADQDNQLEPCRPRHHAYGRQPMTAATPTPPAAESVRETSVTMRNALQDIADAQPIPNDAVAFVWCRTVATEALDRVKGAA